METFYIICEYCHELNVILFNEYEEHLFTTHKVIFDEEKNYSRQLLTKHELIKTNLEKDHKRMLEANETLDEYMNRLAKEDPAEYELLLEQYLALKQKGPMVSISKQTPNDHFIAESDSFNVIWDEISFAKDEVQLDLKRFGGVKLRLKCDGVFTELNLIKDEYFKRLYSNKIYTITLSWDGNLVADTSPGWRRIQETIEFAKEFYAFRYWDHSTKDKIFDVSGLEGEQILKLFEGHFSKSEYLKFLASLQAKEYKLIPIREYINNHFENSFIFRFKTKQRNILFVWENGNEARATHVFTTNEENHLQQNIKIQEFILRSDSTSKRAKLYGESSAAISLKTDLGFLCTLKHNDVNNFRYNIGRLIDTN